MPEKRRVQGKATADNDVSSPHHRHQIEDNQTARVKIFACLHFGQVQSLDSALCIYPSYLQLLVKPHTTTQTHLPDVLLE